MKYIVSHASPDWDAIGSIWLIKKYLSGWQNADVLFVPAGQRVRQSKYTVQNESEPHQVTDDVIEVIGNNEYIHVDTGLGPLDHHQTKAMNECATSRTWKYIQTVHQKVTKENTSHTNEKNRNEKIKNGSQSTFTPEHGEAISRIVNVIVAIDHFQEVFWPDAEADWQEFSLLGALDGLKLEKLNQDMEYVRFGLECLNALVHQFENRIWAEKEIKEIGQVFTTRWGRSIGFETINDTVLKLAQKMGYVIVVRKDPRKGYVRIKARPERAEKDNVEEMKKKSEQNIDLTLMYEKLRKIDPDATWFLHVSKKMLLNGTPKNPKMIPTKLSLREIIGVLETI